MPGILRYGAYVPFFRLPRSKISAAWTGGGGSGEKAVANHDEDSLTLAVEAARDCLSDYDRQEIDGLFFVSTTHPYREKSGAAFIASVLGLRPDILTADFSNSLRYGITALELASAYVETGRGTRILVVFSDTRTAYPGSPQECWMGDGAAAFLVGREEGGARLAFFLSHAHDMMDVWRTDTDRFVQSWEDRWGKQHGLFEVTADVVRGILHKVGMSPDEVDRAVLCAPDPRSHRQLAKKLGLDPDEQVAEPLFETMGAAGAAQGPLMLALVLEEAAPEQSILITGYGDGADAALLRTGEEVRSLKGRTSVSGALRRRRELLNYERYLWYRGLVEVVPPPALLVDSSAPILLREHKQIYQLVGSTCSVCGEAAYPIQRICTKCQAKDAYEEIFLAESKGRLFTYTLDHLASRVDPPLVQCVVDLDVGCRIYTQMTDVDPEAVELGMEVEMTFRRTRKAAGFYNYFWKCRPSP